MSVKRIALSCLITGCLLITAQGFGFDLGVIFGKYLSMEDIQKLVGDFVFYEVNTDFWKYFVGGKYTDLGTRQPKLLYCTHWKVC